MSFYIESLGCAKNQVDSELILAALEQAGLSWVDNPDDAGLIIINSCGFIDPAKEESVQTALEIRNRYPDKKIIMTGCLVQRYQSDLQAALGDLDGITGSRNLERFVSSVSGLIGKPAVSAPSGYREFLLQHRRKLLSYPGSAFVKLAEGCNNRCTYCSIPLIRGDLSSRRSQDIRAEVKQLLERGIREINLIAQDLSSFGMDRGGRELPALLEQLSALAGRFWIRLLYLHPDHFPAPLLEIMERDPRILPYFDLPFQHASPQLLSRMGREGSYDGYLGLIRQIRERLPEAIIRSTFLLGFPGETEEDFQSLLAFQQEAALDWLGVFTYSREEGTTAFNLPGRVGKRAARLRRARIEELQIPITQERLDSWIGRRLEALVEERIQGEDLYLARSYLQAPEADGLVVIKGRNLIPGTIVPVRILRRAGLDLEAVHGG